MSRARTPLIDPETRTPWFDLLAGTPLHAFGWTDGSGKVRVAAPGLSGWLEGLVDQAALEPLAQAEPVATGIAGHLVGDDAPPIVPVPIPTPGPLSVRSGSVHLIHGGEPYQGPVVVTDRGVTLTTRGRRSLFDGEGRPFDPARHGAARWWLTDRGYTLDTRLDEVVLPGGAHLVRNPEVHGRAIEDVW